MPLGATRGAHRAMLCTRIMARFAPSGTRRIRVERGPMSPESHSNSLFSETDIALSLSGERPDHMTEECGVFGVFAPGEDVARLTYFGLHALQHRGQESAGISVGDGKTVMTVKNLGLVLSLIHI